MQDRDQPQWLDHERDAMLERARRLDEARAMSEDEAFIFAHSDPQHLIDLRSSLLAAVLAAVLLGATIALVSL